MPIAASACAFWCGDDRNPSRILIELPESLENGSYDVLACVDDDCDRFVAVPSPGTGATPGADIDIGPDTILVTPWARQIAPGEHRVEFVVSGGDTVLLSFDGRALFEENDRCHRDDSNTTISAEPLATG